jgi:hypothetical protein
MAWNLGERANILCLKSTVRCYDRVRHVDNAGVTFSHDAFLTLGAN